MNKQKKIILLDAHAIIHRAYHALPDFSNTEGQPTGALFGITSMVIKIIETFDPEYIIACFDLPEKTFRHHAFAEYKGTRKKSDETLVLQITEAYTLFQALGIPIYESPGFEADDILGTLVRILSETTNHDIIIASGDMDTLQLTAYPRTSVFTLKKGIHDTVLYTATEVKERFGFEPHLLPDYKGLRGDPSDNIPGITGIGEKTATTLITGCGSLESLYALLKRDPGQVKALGLTDRIMRLLEEGKEDAFFSKTLATIRTDAPIDYAEPIVSLRAGTNFETLEALMHRYEFKSLIPRLKKVFHQSEVSEKNIPYDTHKDDTDRIRRLAIALWILHSEKTNASYDDILRETKTHSLDETEQVLMDALTKENLVHIYQEIELPIIESIARMSEYGVLIDANHFASLSKKLHQELEALTAAIYTEAGHEFNINSPKQLGEVLFDELGLQSKSKKRSTKSEVLESLRDKHPIIPLVSTYREIHKLTSTYIDALPEYRGSDGRIHAHYLQHGTTTGRFSSLQPNMQNIPIQGQYGTDIRNGFIAPEGKVLLACDYSQIELRIAALLSRDTELLTIFKNGQDVHTSVAASVFGVAPEAVTKDMRRKAKVINFGVLYGMGVLSLKKNLETSKEEAQIFYDTYFKTFHQLHDYLEAVKQKAVATGYTETLFGRKREFPQLRSRIPYIRAMTERMAINAPIQGTSADIIKLAIRFITDDLRTAGLSESVHLIMQIHDELVFEVDEAVRDRAYTIITRGMQEVVERSWLACTLEIPLIVSASYGTRWGGMEPFTDDKSSLQ
jgi:DNA polymerase I